MEEQNPMEKKPVTPPIKAGEEYEVKIEAIGDKGDGIAKIQGFVVFIPKVEMDEHYKVRIKRVVKKCAFAEVLE